MKKVFLCIALIATLGSMTVKASAFEEPTEYYYGFILSCGEVVYLTFNRELSEEEFLSITDYFEGEMCDQEVPGEVPID